MGGLQTRRTGTFGLGRNARLAKSLTKCDSHCTALADPLPATNGHVEEDRQSQVYAPDEVPRRQDEPLEHYDSLVLVTCLSLTLVALSLMLITPAPTSPMLMTSSPMLITFSLIIAYDTVFYATWVSLITSYDSAPYASSHRKSGRTDGLYSADHTIISIAMCNAAGLVARDNHLPGVQFRVRLFRNLRHYGDRLSIRLPRPIPSVSSVSISVL